MSKVISIVNQKGGVGKSLLAANLASAFAIQEAPKPILMIDLDPQKSLTESFNIDASLPEYGGNNVCDLFSDNIDPTACCFTVDSVMEKNKAVQLFIVPSDQKLAVTGMQLFDDPGKIMTFKKNVDILKNYFSYIVIDTLPSLDLLLTTALVACDSVCVVVIPELGSVTSLDLIFPTIKAIKEAPKDSPHNRNIKIEGLILNKRRKLREHEEIEQELSEKYNVLGVVPQSASVMNKAFRSGGLSCVIAHPQAKPTAVFMNIAMQLREENN